VEMCGRLFVLYRTNDSGMAITDENRKTGVSALLNVRSGKTFPNYPLTRPLRAENIASASIFSY
jgi:hypothetical protein